MYPGKLGSPVFLFIWLLLALLSGCSSLPGERPTRQNTVLSPAVDPIVRSLDNGRLELSLLVLDRNTVIERLGVDLTARRIRAVWVEVDNQTDAPYWLLRSSLDWDYYPVSEILYSLQGQLAAEELVTLKERLEKLRFRNPVPAHQRKAGYVFISSNHLNRVARLVLLGTEGSWEVPVLLPVPELRGYRLPEQEDFYGQEEIIDTDMVGLQKLVEAMPCCTTDEQGKGSGDPLNLVLVGEASDLRYALAARGWHTVERNYLQSAEKTIKSFLFGDKYRYSPVSPLYVFGRKQDYALQKARANISQRNHLRLWLAPWRIEGKPVWVGQVSRDIGVHMTSKSPIFFTHKIDPDVDEDRNYLMEDLILSDQVNKIGYLHGTGRSTADEPRANLTGDAYYTDGLRAVIFIGSHREAVYRKRRNELIILDWKHSDGKQPARHIDRPR